MEKYGVNRKMTLERQISIEFYESRLHQPIVDKLKRRAELVCEAEGKNFDDFYCQLLVKAYTNYLRTLERKK